MSGASSISTQARGYEYDAGIWTDAQVASWRNATDAVRGAGDLTVLRRWHTGRLSHPALQADGVPPVSASAIPPEG